MKLMMALLLTGTVTTVAWGQERDPIGETAHYEVDLDRERTSSMILSGQFDTTVVGMSETAETPSYQVDLDYTFRVRLFGNQTGTESVEVPVEYFTPEFLGSLRANGTFTCDKFTVDHVGVADATTMDGTTYPMCDVLHFHDIDTSSSSYWTYLFHNIAVATLLSQGVEVPTVRFGEIRDLQIRAHVSFGQPVLGAVKLDVSGYYDNIFIKAGADYQP